MPDKKYNYERVTFYHNGRRYDAYGHSLAEAHRKSALKKIALENGDIGTSCNMTVSSWANDWFETYKEHSVGHGQYLNYKTIIDSIIIPAIGNKRLKDVNDTDLQRIINSKAGCSKSYLTKIRYTLHGIFKRAKKSRLIPFNPADDLELPLSTDGTYRSITDFERVSILAFCPLHYAGLWIKTLLFCGLRPAETRALDWRHIDFNYRRINIVVSMKADTTIIDSPKSAAGVRSVPVPDSLLADFAAVKRDPFLPVFLQPTTGRRHTDTSMRCLWLNFKRELDIFLGASLYRNQIVISKLAPDLVPYCLRHTYGTDLQNAGVPINVAKYLMGHSDIGTTANIYTDTSDKVINAAAVSINEYHNYLFMANS
jgi:integrase